LKVIDISGVIGWDVSASSIKRQLREAGDEDITINIASPGGFVYDGIEIFNAIRMHSRSRKSEVTTHLVGIAASMASYIALAGDKRTAEKNSIFMIHNVWGVGVGDHNELRKDAEHFEALTKILAAQYEEITGKSNAEIRKMMDADTYLYGQEIADQGFVQEIIEGDSEADNTNAGEGDKDTAVALAKATIVEFKKTMNELESEISASSEDLQKAAALIGVKPNGAVNKKQEKKQQEDAEMASLKEYLEKNPEAKAEFDKSVNDAVASALEKNKKPEGSDKLEPAEYAKGYLNNENYPTLGALAADVITGKADVIALQAAVSAIDHAAQAAKSGTASNEQESQPETPAGDLGTDDVTEAKIEANIAANLGIPSKE
jgi:ATP-dependent Clp endopeptidase proteolytic subunit ClpP